MAGTVTGSGRRMWVGGIVVGYGDTELGESVVEVLATIGDAVVVVNPRGTQASVSTPNAARTVNMSTNCGYAAAVNRGASELAGSCDFLLVLTRDADLAHDALDRMLDVILRDDRIAVVGPVTTVGGEARCGGGYSPGRAWHRVGVPAGDVVSVDWVDGSVMLVRRAVFEELGGLDEATFMYVEEVAFCRAIVRAGHRVVVATGAAARQVPGAPNRPRAHGYLVTRNHIRLAGSEGPVARARAVVAAVGLVARSAIRSILDRPPGRRYHAVAVVGISEGLVAGVLGHSGPPPPRVIRGSDVVLGV